MYLLYSFIKIRRIRVLLNFDVKLMDKVNCSYNCNFQ